MKNSLSARLTYRIMGVLLVMMAVIAGVVYVTVKEYMLNEAKERYRNMLLNSHEELRRHLSDVLMTIVNNVHDIERDIDYPDKMFEHVGRIISNNKYVHGCTMLFKPGDVSGKGVPAAFIIGLNNDIYDVFDEVGFTNLFDIR